MSANENPEFWNIPYDINATKFQRFYFWFLIMAIAFFFAGVMGAYVFAPAIKVFIDAPMTVQESNTLNLICAIVPGIITCIFVHIRAVRRRRSIEKIDRAYKMTVRMYIKDCRRAGEEP